MDCSILNDTFGSCKPWSSGRAQNNMNLLNNLKQNLCSYEKVYKKYSVKTKSQLPQIKSHFSAFKNKTFERNSKKLFSRTKNKTLESCNKLKNKSKDPLSNKSVQLHYSKSQSRLFKSREGHKRGQTSLQTNKQNNKEVVTDRKHYEQGPNKPNLKSKLCQINFDQQNKYRRLRKRELHQIIFGQRQRFRKNNLAIDLR